MSLQHMEFYYEIEHDPKPEDAGTIRVNARILREDGNLKFTTLSLADEFINDVRGRCQSTVDLIYFLMRAGINGDHIADVMRHLILHVAHTTTCDILYSPGCALEVWLDLLPLDELHIQEEIQNEDGVRIEEAVRASFDVTNNMRPRPVSKLVVESLPRKIYEKISSTAEKCTICLEEFKNGGRLVTLPCDHYFDDECVVKWFETSHVCPLCRFKLPCEDQ